MSRARGRRKEPRKDNEKGTKKEEKSAKKKKMDDVSETGGGEETTTKKKFDDDNDEIPEAHTHRGKSSKHVKGKQLVESKCLVDLETLAGLKRIG